MRFQQILVAIFLLYSSAVMAKRNKHVTMNNHLGGDGIISGNVISVEGSSSLPEPVASPAVASSILVASSSGVLILAPPMSPPPRFS